MSTSSALTPTTIYLSRGADAQVVPSTHDKRMAQKRLISSALDGEPDIVLPAMTMALRHARTLAQIV